MQEERPDAFDHLPRVNHPVNYSAATVGGWPWWLWWLWWSRPDCCGCCCCRCGEGAVAGGSPAPAPSAPPLNVSLGLGTIPTVGVPIYYLITPQGGDGLVELQWTVSGGTDPITTTLSVVSGPAAAGPVYQASGRQGNYTYKFFARGRYVFEVTAKDANGSGSATFQIVL